MKQVITNVAIAIKVNHWRNTITVLDWFKSLPQKSNSGFLKFDVVELYPPIPEELLNDSISLARSITTINDSIINIIHHSRKSLLLGKTFAWIKKGNNRLFDVTTESYDGAEICNFVGLYLMHG